MSDSPFPGHLRGSGVTRIQAFGLLLREYDNYDPFVRYCRRVSGLLRASLSDFAKKHQLLAETARRWNLHLVPDVIDMNYWHLEQAILQTGKRIRKYKVPPCQGFAEYVEVPPCQGFTEYVEVTPFQGFTTMSFIPRDDVSVDWNGRSWSWLLAGQQSLGSLRGLIMEHLRVSQPDELPAEVRRQLLALPDKARRAGWELSDTSYELERHVKWLFLRLCPQPKEPLSVKEVLELDNYEDERTLRRTVADLAKRLQIEMPGHIRARALVKPS